MIESPRLWVPLPIVGDGYRDARGKGTRHFGQEIGSNFFKYVHPEELNLGDSDGCRRQRRA